MQICLRTESPRGCPESPNAPEIYSHSPEQKQSNSMQAAKKSTNLGYSREQAGMGAHTSNAAAKAWG